MKRTLLVPCCLAAVALLVAPLVALADSLPVPSTLYFGTVAGARPGDAVLAFVAGGGDPVVCGSGSVISDATAGVVYSVEVLADGAKAGCGAIGREVQMYVVGPGGAPGWLALNLSPWVITGAAQHNLVLGASLSQRRLLPESARDGVP